MLRFSLAVQSAPCLHHQRLSSRAAETLSHENWVGKPKRWNHTWQPNRRRGISMRHLLNGCMLQDRCCQQTSKVRVHCQARCFGEPAWWRWSRDTEKISGRQGQGQKEKRSRSIRACKKRHPPRQRRWRWRRPSCISEAGARPNIPTPEAVWEQCPSSQIPMNMTCKLKIRQETSTNSHHPQHIRSIELVNKWKQKTKREKKR